MMLKEIDVRKVRPSGVGGMVISIPIMAGFKPYDLVQVQQIDEDTLVIKKIKVIKSIKIEPEEQIILKEF